MPNGTLKALNNYVVAAVDQPTDRQAVSQHDILIPAGANSWKTTGMVVSAGPTCRIAGLGPGVRILFSPFAVGHKVTGPDKVEYQALLDHQILGYFTDTVVE